MQRGDVVAYLLSKCVEVRDSTQGLQSLSLVKGEGWDFAELGKDSSRPREMEC